MTRMTQLVGRPTVAALLIVLTGCASQPTITTQDSDPLEPVNRVVYKINDVADTFVLRPVAKGYEWLLPSFARTGLNNFFDNLDLPRNIVNAFLQAKFRQGLSDAARMALNSTLGLGGLLDPATAAGLSRNNEDFGQTLAAWGVPQGPYLIVPILGPRTARHAVGTFVDWQYQPQNLVEASSVRDKVNMLWLVQRRSTLLGIDAEVNRAFDEYSFIRDAYLQNRRFQIYDGRPPDEMDFNEEFGDFDEFDEFEAEDL